jgi:hypothetical protein
MNVDVTLSVFRRKKREDFDPSYLRSFYPNYMDSFEYLPSVGASRGAIIV